jgi:hypothetical protein
VNLAGTPAVLAACNGSASPTSIDEVVARVGRDGVRFLFVGERHGVGPAKRFAVDLANALAELEVDVGLYVEGFRTDCAPRDTSCPSIARLFNDEAFFRLLDEARVPVHPIDPPAEPRRAAGAGTAGAGRP